MLVDGQCGEIFVAWTCFKVHRGFRGGSPGDFRPRQVLSPIALMIDDLKMLAHPVGQWLTARFMHDFTIFADRQLLNLFTLETTRHSNGIISCTVSTQFLSGLTRGYCTLRRGCRIRWETLNLLFKLGRYS